MDGQLPKFLGIGAQKGGTTTLQCLLEQHPQVFVPPRKELHYFSLHYGEGEAWYRRQFADARSNQLCGEITPYYLFHPVAPQRVKALLPNVKLIVLLRDPVERTLSQVFHSRRLGLEPLPLEAALDAEIERLKGAEALLDSPNGRHQSHQEHSYVARSRYELQLQRWSSLFPRDQFFVQRSEDFFEQPQKVWAQLCEFLQIDQLVLPSLGSRRIHSGSGEIDQISTTHLSAVRRALRDSLASTYIWLDELYGLRWS